MASEIKKKLQIFSDNQGLRSFVPTLLDAQQKLDCFDEEGTPAEIRLLEEHVDSIAMSLLPGTVIIDVGYGSLQQTRILLEAFESHHKIVDYYALSTSQDRLQRTLEALDSSRFNHVRCHGLLGSIHDGRAWVAKYENKQRPVCVLSLGNTVSGMTRTEVEAFWRQWSALLTINNKFNSNNARIIVGVDHYRESAGNTAISARSLDERFVKQLIKSANDQLGFEASKSEEWVVKGEWDKVGKSFTQYLVPKKDLAFEGINVKAGEKIFVAHSHKYDEGDMVKMLHNSNLKELQHYKDSEGHYGTSTTERKVAFPESAADVF